MGTRVRLLAALLVVCGSDVVETGAACSRYARFPISMCGGRAYVEPSPLPVAFDPQTGRVAGGVTAVFWQIGFGNDLLNTGLGTTGTGNSALTTFNGNDGGTRGIVLVEAGALTGNPAFPAGALCDDGADWGAPGVDGCCDNPRDSFQIIGSDEILNPYFDQYWGSSGYFGYYSLAWIQDYPTAVLLKTAPDARYFAAAAVASKDRGNDGSGENGPCFAPFPGPNPGPCDLRQGLYDFADVVNGAPNPLVPGARNVIPWQEVPRPSARCVADCGGPGPLTMDFEWAPSRWVHDGSVRPSANRAMAPEDPTRAAGVGVVDLLRKLNATDNWRGLIRYDLESAPITAADIDPDGDVVHSGLAFSTAIADVLQPIDPGTGEPNDLVRAAGVAADPDTCWRVKVRFGKKPETNTTTTTRCRVGKCGDRGYEAASRDPAVVACVRPEAFREVAAERERGSIAVSWTMGSEWTIRGFNVHAVTARGTETRLNQAPIPCSECSTGAAASYREIFPAAAAPGARRVVVEALAAAPIRSGPASIGR